MNRAPTTRRFWFPSLSVSIWLIFFLALTLSNWRFVLISADGDPCLHRRLGDWMIANHTVPRTDQFSHTRAGAALISKEWLGELVFAAASKALDWNGAVLLAAALIATCLWALNRQILAEGGDPLLATALTLVAALTASHHWLARPHLVTHLLVVVFSWKLRAFERNRLAAPRLFAWLLPLMLLWANAHGAFFTGFVVIGTATLGTASGGWAGPAAERAARRRQTAVLVMLGTGCLLVTLVNPNGWRLHGHILEFLRTPLLAGYANEFASPNFHTGGMRGFLVILLLLGILLTVVRPRLRPTDITAIAVWGWLALHSVRNVAIFGLVVAPILAEHFQVWLRAAAPTGWLAWYRRLNERVVGLQRTAGGAGLVALAVLLMVLAMAKTPLGRGQPLLTTQLLADRFPVAAVAFLQQHPDAVTGEMFNSYGWGGYLMWALPEHKVFVDGRNDFYGADFLREFDRLDAGDPGWDAVIDKYHVGWAILPVRHPLASLLALCPDWKPVYRDSVAVIYNKTR